MSSIEIAYCITQFSSFPSSSINTPGQNLIRLCRRATARFPLDSIGGKSGSGEHILSLWVLYAKAQSEFGTREEAKRTYWRIDAVLNKDSADDGGAADGSASFYLTMADFERTDCSKGDRAAVRNAVKVLQTGLERGARPAGILQDRIKELEGEIGGGASSSSSSSSLLALGRSDSLTGQVSNVTRATSNGGNGGDMDEDKNDDDEDTDDVVFFKKKGKKVAAPAKRVGAGVSAAAPVATDDDDVTKLDVSQTTFAATQSSPDDNDATIALPANAIGQSGLQRTGPSKPTTSREGVSFAPGMESSSVRVKSSISTRMAAAGSSASSLHRTPGKLTARKDPALSSSRKPLLARKKIGGGAMRVTAFDEQPVESSDEDDDGPNLMSVANKRKGGGSSGDDSKPPPQKVSKMDIGYLLNWDPTAHKRKETEDSEKKEPKPPSSFAASKLPAMEKIEEESTGNTERSNRSQASNASSKSNHDQTFDTTRRNNQTAESHGSAGNGNSRSSKHSQHATPSASNSGELLANNGGGAGAAAAGHPSISPGQLALVAKSNADFLPLVSEDNIIRVNNTPFVTNKRKGGGSSGDDSKPPPQKVSKMDIGYLLNWDPTAHKRKETEDSEKKEPKPPSSFAASKLPAMEKIEEESTGNTERSNRSQASNASSKSNHDQTFDTTRRNNQTAESHGSAGNGNSRSSKHSQHATPSASNSGELLANNGGGAGAAAAGHPSISPGQLALVAKSNADFLPLVSEDNIIRVNNTPFVKLGVIGRGGSCKVYRALSKECNVVAIKKVKLAGMDKKSINSYANEIRLLKSLRGNPAIIQLYDSEVDLQRKAIFLVMELGEVDLNHVLQQQALLDGQQQGGGSSCRNMNFIRLTWQQMLSAVHSIHEERIIHGDLKPANFLFVRGTLKLIDFGIAKAIQNDDTTNIYRDSQIGTLNYMSPESILDTGTGTSGAKMKCGRPSDVWALGCILYQMCYGRTPFAELRVIQKLQAIVNPNHEISFPDTVDEAAVDAIKLCIRRKAEDRAPIVGENGLLNEHWFLHSGKRRSGSSGASNK